MPTTTSEPRHSWTASILMLAAIAVAAATAVTALVTQPEPVTFEVAPADSFTHGHHQDVNPPPDMSPHLNNQEPAL